MLTRQFCLVLGFIALYILPAIVQSQDELMATRAGSLEQLVAEVSARIIEWSSNETVVQHVNLEQLGPKLQQ